MNAWVYRLHVSFHDRYIKPTKRPEPPPVLDPSFTGICRSSSCYEKAQRKDLLWKISRLRKPEEPPQQVPGWTGFNSLLSTSNQTVATIRYLPFIQAPPADFTTIYTTLLRLVQLAEKLDQTHILVTADMQIYSKAQEILWANPQALDGKVTMRLGGMHLTMAYLASLGGIYGDAGLLSLLADSGVYAEATARQMLQGKQYARGIRGVKLVQEALFRNFYAAMESWLHQQGRTLVSPELEGKLHELKGHITSKDSNRVTEVSVAVEEEYLSTVQKNIDDFTEAGQAQSDTFTFWRTFLDGADTLLHLLRAEREANFMLHLNGVCETIPWFHAAGRRTYAKYVPTYIADMKALENTNPESYRHLCQGGFVVRRSDNYSFNCVATDQALEQTVNRDGKSKGGVIGLTLRKSALTRWLKTRHVTAEYVESFTSLCNTGVKDRETHPELGKARMARDEADVCKIVETASQYQNPFDLDTVPSDLINIATGRVASNDVAQSLNTFLESGKKTNDAFIQARLVQATKSKTFWDPQKRSKAMTFSDMRKSAARKKLGGVTSDSEVLFRRLLVVSKQREVSLEKVLEHELAGVPPSLFNDDGTMRKTSKAELAKKLEASCDQVHTLPAGRSTAYIIDGMALLQSQKETLFSTFDDLGMLLKRYLKRLFASDLAIVAIVFVFDRYDNPNSVKQMERERRGDEQRASHIIKGNRQVPNYRKFMRTSANKTALATFLSEYLIAVKDDLLEEGHTLILAGGFADGEIVKAVKMDSVSDLPNLASTHEEADTRLVLHAIHMCQDYDRIIVKSDDTDVLVILLYYRSINLLDTLVYMHAGHTTQFTQRECFIPINAIVDKIGANLCQNLPAVHAITGCDSTSSLYKVGKNVAYTKLAGFVKDDPLGLVDFGLTNNVDDDISSARKYVLSVYSNKRVPCATLDQLRYVLASTTDKAAAHLPPTEDAFKQHVLRARYQTSIWCNSHLPKPTLWNPVGNGWRLNESHHLEPVTYTGEAAPVEVRNLTHLYCTDTECTLQRKCHCVKMGLPCIEFCSCDISVCSNVSHMAQAESDDDI